MGKHTHIVLLLVLAAYKKRREIQVFFFSIFSSHPFISFFSILLILSYSISLCLVLYRLDSFLCDKCNKNVMKPTIKKRKI